MNTTHAEIIVIGAGMAGLTAALELAFAGKKVIIVEGRDRPGGRIDTLEYHFSQPIDAGAEFIHGDLPLTKKLVKQSDASFHKKKGKLYKYENGTVTEIKEMIDDYKKVMSRLKDLSKDLPLSEFIKIHLNGTDDEKARKSALRMAEGFDVAEPEKISSFAVRDEWKEGTISDPYILKDGYGQLVKRLYHECLAAGCHIHFSSPVTQISWKKNSVKVRCGQQTELESEKLIITVPLGVLTASEDEKNYIRFIPAVHDRIAAAKKIGYGPVVKAIFEFRHCFWDDHNFKNKLTQLPDLGFFITDSIFPTWWTHAENVPILTAWAGGPNAEKLKGQDATTIAEQALTILADVFSTDLNLLNELLVSHKVIDWGSDPFSKGAYSYDTVESKEARKLLLQPVEDTLYFCGEALDENGLAGTVEAALSSAKHLVKQLI